MNIDHIIPLSKGGNNSKFNKIYTCLRCNSYKSNLTLEEFAIFIKKMEGKKLKSHKKIDGIICDLILYKIEKLITYRDNNMSKMIK